MKIQNILFITFMLSIAYSCKHQPDLSGYDPSLTDTSAAGIPCNKDTVYFNRDILPLVQSNCAMSGCHDAITHKEDINLTTYADIIKDGEVKAGKPFSSKLYEVITESNPKDIMPPLPQSPFTAAQIALVKKWIEQGAKNNYCSECDSTAFKFNANILPIVNTYCTGCHSGTVPSGNVFLRNYADVKAMVDANKIKSVIAWTGVKNMPPAKKLQDCKIDNINKWIANGALND